MDHYKLEWLTLDGKTDKHLRWQKHDLRIDLGENFPLCVRDVWEDVDVIRLSKDFLGTEAKLSIVTSDDGDAQILMVRLKKDKSEIALAVVKHKDGAWTQLIAQVQPMEKIDATAETVWTVHSSNYTPKPEIGDVANTTPETDEGKYYIAYRNISSTLKEQWSYVTSITTGDAPPVSGTTYLGWSYNFSERKLVSSITSIKLMEWIREYQYKGHTAGLDKFKRFAEHEAPPIT